MTHANSITHDQAMLEIMRDDPQSCLELLNEVFLEGDQGLFLTALRHYANAIGSNAMLARKANVNATSLYRSLSATGDPKFSTLVKVCKAMGLQLQFAFVDSDREKRMGLRQSRHSIRQPSTSSVYPTRVQPLKDKAPARPAVRKRVKREAAYAQQ